VAEQCVHSRRPRTGRAANRIPNPHSPADVPAFKALLSHLNILAPPGGRMAQHQSLRHAVANHAHRQDRHSGHRALSAAEARVVGNVSGLRRVLEPGKSGGMRMAGAPRVLLTGSSGGVGRVAESVLAGAGCEVRPFDLAEGQDLRNPQSVLDAMRGYVAVSTPGRWLMTARAVRWTS
jgi:hypothetical protein